MKNVQAVEIGTLVLTTISFWGSSSILGRIQGQATGILAGAGVEVVAIVVSSRLEDRCVKEIRKNSDEIGNYWYRICLAAPTGILAGVSAGIIGAAWQRGLEIGELGRFGRIVVGALDWCSEVLEILSPTKLFKVYIDGVEVKSSWGDSFFLKMLVVVSNGLLTSLSAVGAYNSMKLVRFRHQHSALSKRFAKLEAEQKASIRDADLKALMAGDQLEEKEEGVRAEAIMNLNSEIDDSSQIV